MTDKDIKDYCKNCDVEPPAMRFKCPECEHNPDNENNFAKDINVPHKGQIIIHRVDVSGCNYSGSQENCIIRAHQKCSNYPNCYFKQLARKTQECEALKSESFTMNSLIIEQEEEIDRYCKALEEIEEYCKEQNLKYDTTACIILDIINKVKDKHND